MKTAFKLTSIVLFLSIHIAQAEEIPVTSRIESISLFKNGLAMVRRTVDTSGPGIYRVENVPNSVHGTFWIESRGPVVVRVTSREVEVPANSRGAGDFQTDLVGRLVTLHFRDSSIPPVSGKIVEISQPRGDRAWNRTYQQPEYQWWNGGYRNPSPGQIWPPQGKFLILETDKGRTYADSSMIAHLSVEGVVQTVKQRMPVLLLDLEGENREPSTITISYLTKGIAWAPSYRVNLQESNQLTIEQQAVIKNELEDFEDVELRLISGFPSVQFAHVTSPMSLETSWAQFFTQLNQRMADPSGVGGAMGQRITANFSPLNNSGVDLSAIPTGEGVDLHYESIGKRSMNEGDALMLAVGKAPAEYERIVEWIIPDTRDVDGRFIEEHRRNQEPVKYQDAAWDAVKFKNPLPFPMTTGPATVTTNDQFNGQRMSYWVNPGEQTTLQITKALSVRTRMFEQEEAGQERDPVTIGGRKFRKVSVKGEVLVNNHRKEEIKLVIRRQFSGELVKADGDPRNVLREQGVYSINRRNELTWTLNLLAGEEKTFNYQYTVLVPH